jgi:hypothetical protein
LNVFEDVELNTVQFIGPLIVLIVTIIGMAIVYRLLFNWLPKKLFNFLLGPVALFGFYIWLIPMDLGFYELFK